MVFLYIVSGYPFLNNVVEDCETSLQKSIVLVLSTRRKQTPLQVMVSELPILDDMMAPLETSFEVCEATSTLRRGSQLEVLLFIVSELSILGSPRRITKGRGSLKTGQPNENFGEVIESIGGIPVR